MDDAETLDSMFENSSRSRPNNIAVAFNSGTTRKHATYEELDVQASKVADFLGTLCEEQEVIAVYSKQSIGLVACILGVLRHKSCFAPIDLNWPPDTICSFLSKLNVSLVLVDKELLESFQSCLLPWKHGSASHECIRNEVLDANGFLLVRKLLGVKQDSPRQDAAYTQSPSLAYVMQTSGTTGDPKAVRVPHRCIVPNITDLGDIFQVMPDDVVFLASPYTFDPFIVQMFITFAAGARLVIVPERVKMVPSELCKVLFDEERVTLLQPTPALMHYIGQDLIQSKVLSEDSSLRVLAFGGESCPTLSTLRRWRPLGSNASIYNLYGVTEVSCWASCHLIPNDQLAEERVGTCDDNLRQHDLENFPVDVVNDVPLGLPLLDTFIEVRDENNELVTEGTGQIYLGGSGRVCLLGDETSLAAGTMRATGDWAYVKGSCIWFCGRKDRQIKHLGKRINLDWIEREISDKILNNACSLVLDKSANTNHLGRIHLFVVDAMPFDKKKLVSVRGDLLKLLPVDAQPDFVHTVADLPMTAHGKVDRIALLSGVEEMSNAGDIKISIREFLELAWKESLDVNKAREIAQGKVDSKFAFRKKDRGNFIGDNIHVTEDDMFVASGGSSLDAVRLADSIESWISKQEKAPVKLPELLDVILSKPFSTLCHYVESKLAQTDRQGGLEFKSTPLGSINAGSSGDDLGTIAGQQGRDEEMNLDLNSNSGFTQQAGKLRIKRKLSSQTDGASLAVETEDNSKRATMKNFSSEETCNSCKDETCSASELKNCFCSVRRGNQWTVCKFCRNVRPSQLGNMTSQSHQAFAQSSSRRHETVTLKNHSQSFSSLKSAKAPGTDPGTHLTITCQWHTCLYKCIDASPLVIYSPARCEGEVFIGSHGHMFMCIRLSDGKVLWESRVGDRIESSAALSMCGKYVIVGCYDGKVDVFTRSTGEMYWTFQTGAAVKSSPCVDPQTGVVWVGSHDHHLYGIDIINKQCICAIDCGGGSCFSSPCTSSDPHLVFIATLAGRVLAIDATEYTILWSQQCPKPVFASLLLIPNGVVCACVDGFLYCFDFQGKELWKFEARASVFCSPSYIAMECDSNSNGYIVFGSHDKCVYCLSLNGDLHWSFNADGQVYSSPFVAELNSNHFTTCQAKCFATCHAICHGKCCAMCHTTCCNKCDLSYTQMAVFVFSAFGTLYILELYSGVLLGSYSLPGEVFSSPVVIDKRVLVGCRNDYMYSLEMSNTN